MAAARAVGGIRRPNRGMKPGRTWLLAAISGSRQRCGAVKIVISYLRGYATELKRFNGPASHAWCAWRGAGVGGGDASDDCHDSTLFVFMFLRRHGR